MRLRPILKKKAQGADILVWIVSFFCLMMFAGIWYYAVSEIKTEMEKTELFENEVANQSISTVTEVVTTLRWASVGIFVVMVIAIFAAAYIVESHPIYLIPHIFFMIVAVIAAVVISNAYEEISTDPILSSTFSTFPAPNMLISYLPLWVAVVGFISVIFLVAKMRGGMYE